SLAVVAKLGTPPARRGKNRNDQRRVQEKGNRMPIINIADNQPAEIARAANAFGRRYTPLLALLGALPSDRKRINQPEAIETRPSGAGAQDQPSGEGLAGRGGDERA